MLKSGIKDVLGRFHDLENEYIAYTGRFLNQYKLGEIEVFWIHSLISIGSIIFGLLGNTLANFDNDYELLHNLSNILKSGDLLLLELAATESISTESKGFAKARI